jgi:hypothetical protein
MPSPITEPQCAYAVEVSGWDSNGDFFVERTELRWSEGSAKHVRTTHRIAPGTLLFLRLLNSVSVDCAHPVTYVAERVATQVGGQYRVQLVPARRRSY